MSNKVKVTGDKNGNIIAVTKNPEYGYVRVEQEVCFINNEGWLKSSVRSAFIKGKIEDLERLNYKVGQEIPGKIIVVESLVPFNVDNPDQHLKIAGDTGIICRIGDEPIYRETFYTTNMNLEDELLSHTNSDEIRDTTVAQKNLLSLTQQLKTAKL